MKRQTVTKQRTEKSYTVLNNNQMVYVSAFTRRVVKYVYNAKLIESIKIGMDSLSPLLINLKVVQGKILSGQAWIQKHGTTSCFYIYTIYTIVNHNDSTLLL